MKITNRPGAFGIDVKRFHFPASITATCPECGEEVTKDYENEYLSYPAANVEDEITMYHYNEDNGDEHEWPVKVILKITLELAP